jgi:regulator of ribosome biosynthesis
VYLDPYEDQYAKKREEKSAKIDKNKKQQIRNKAEGAAVEKGLDPRAVRKAELEAKLRASKKATASVGHFDKKLEGDVKSKGVKRKFAPTFGNLESEREAEMAMAQKVIKKQTESAGIVNLKKAANFVQQVEERNNRMEKKKDKKKKFGGKGSSSSKSSGNGKSFSKGKSSSGKEPTTKKRKEK